MIFGFSNKTHHANSTKWDVMHRGKKLFTGVISEYDNASGEPYWQASLFDTNHTLIARGECTDTMQDSDDLADLVLHAINLEKHDVISADLEDPDGRKHRIVWCKLEITGYDEALENMGVRSFIWDTPDDAPIIWKHINDENGGRYVAWPATVNLQGDGVLAGPVQAHQVPRGTILEPGDFYVWADL
ncbi:hypothetical protein [Corynebacterium pseudogenitalium]|uniref:Uncharacterized protein n=1 Tax=Corynebacterium pseudogenitalium TaxID=38303 RepID=A0ABD4TUR8_9CORY|nr:hypothetical protein [Corynebacterium pseudogenitalium]MCQ4615061.1 hypothetical protein [Corynebacterium pseudogenitalium]